MTVIGNSLFLILHMCKVILFLHVSNFMTVPIILTHKKITNRTFPTIFNLKLYFLSFFIILPDDII